MSIKQYINIPDNPPNLLIIAGPCRVGTTALANTFAKAGINVYMQPIKSVRRAIEDADRVIPWDISEEEGSFVVSKETLGPKTPAEFFNPIQILLEAGYPKDKLYFMPIVRDPRKALPSWRQMWDSVDQNKFLESYNLTLEIKDYAESNAIKTIPYVHEVIRDQNPDNVIYALFSKLNLQEKLAQNLSHWGTDYQFAKKDSVDSHCKFYDVPPERFIKDVREWGGYQFKEEPELFLSQEDALFLKNHQELKKIYEIFRRECQESLDLKIQPYDALNY